MEFLLVIFNRTFYLHSTVHVIGGRHLLNVFPGQLCGKIVLSSVKHCCVVSIDMLKGGSFVVLNLSSLREKLSQEESVSAMVSVQWRGVYGGIWIGLHKTFMVPTAAGVSAESDECPSLLSLCWV